MGNIEHDIMSVYSILNVKHSDNICNVLFVNVIIIFCIKSTEFSFCRNSEITEKNLQLI